MIKKKTIAIPLYILVLIVLFLFVEIFPKLSDEIKNTYVIKHGQLSQIEESKFLVVRKEKVYSFPNDIHGKLIPKDGDIVAKSEKIVEKKQDIGLAKNKNSKEDIERIEKALGKNLHSSKLYADAQGVFSTYIDGFEAKLKPKKIKDIRLGDFSSYSRTYYKMPRAGIKKDVPSYKIIENVRWYMVCFVGNNIGEKLMVGNLFDIEFNGKIVTARVETNRKEGRLRKIVFSSSRYHKDMPDIRIVDGKIHILNSSGLILPTEYIAEKSGQKGVYILNKVGEETFVPINIKASNGEENIVSEGYFYDKDGQMVNTLNNFDEVIANPM